MSTVRRPGGDPEHDDEDDDPKPHRHRDYVPVRRETRPWTTYQILMYINSTLSTLGVLIVVIGCFIIGLEIYAIVVDIRQNMILPLNQNWPNYMSAADHASRMIQSSTIVDTLGYAANITGRITTIDIESLTTHVVSLSSDLNAIFGVLRAQGGVKMMLNAVMPF